MMAKCGKAAGKSVKRALERESAGPFARAKGVKEARKQAFGPAVVRELVADSDLSAGTIG